MTAEDSPILEYYPTNFKVDMEGKKFLWQGIVLLPFIDEKKLLKAGMSLEIRMSFEEEKSKCKHNLPSPSFSHFSSFLSFFQFDQKKINLQKKKQEETQKGTPAYSLAPSTQPPLFFRYPLPPFPSFLPLLSSNLPPSGFICESHPLRNFPPRDCPFYPCSFFFPCPPLH